MTTDHPLSRIPGRGARIRRRRPVVGPGLLGALIAFLACLIAAPVGAQAAAPRAVARVPLGFVGMNIDGPTLTPRVNLSQQLRVMVKSGVERVRVVFPWADEQPYRSRATAPRKLGSGWVDVNGVPTNFSATDRLVALSAAQGLEVVPVVIYAPRWAAKFPDARISNPTDPRDYGRYIAALVRRYGRGGTFWRARPSLPRLPIRWWQVWNEPDQSFFWPDSGWQAGYVRLLRAAHDAIKGVDRQAAVVFAGTPDYSWRYLGEIYKFPGARKLFDIFAVHPYTTTPDRVYTILKLVRQVMDANGDRGKAMIATEISFPASQGKTQEGFPFVTDQQNQARYTPQTMLLLARHRVGLRLLGIYIYTWMGTDQPADGAFSYSGMFRLSSGGLTPEPVYSAFRRTALALESCRAKGVVITSCVN